MTKLVTTIAALQLFERGRFTMDTPLRAILPEFADTRRGRTVVEALRVRV